MSLAIMRKRNNGMKKYFILILLVCLVFVSGISAYIYSLRPTNIFAEIYQDEYAGFQPLKKGWHLSKIKAIDRWNRPEAIGEFAQMPNETYKTDTLPKKIQRAGYNFYFYKEKAHMIMYFERELADNTSLYFSSYYNVKTKKLTKSFDLVKTEQDERTYLEDSSEIQQILDQYGINKDKLDHYYKEGIDFMLKDWCLVYDSRFSVDDWGDVKVVTKW